MAEYWQLIEGKVIHIFDMDGNRICQSPNSVFVRGGSRGGSTAHPLTNDCKAPGSDEFVFFRGRRERAGRGILLGGLGHGGVRETIYVFNSDGGVLTPDQTIVGIGEDDISDYFREDSKNMYEWMPHVLDFDESTQSGWFNWTTTGGLSVIESDTQSNGGRPIPVLSIAPRLATTEDPFRFHVIRSLNSLQSSNLFNSSDSSAAAGRVRDKQHKAPEVAVDGSGRVHIKLSRC